MIELEKGFKEFVDENFEFVESQFEDSVDVYSSPILKFRIVEGRNSKLYMSISTLAEPESPSDWIIMKDLRSYMMDNDDYLRPSEFKDVSKFFQENYNDILSLLTTKYDEVREALKKRGNHRAQLQFKS